MRVKYQDDERVFVKLKPATRDNFKVKATELGFLTMMSLLEKLGEVSSSKLKELLK